MVRLAQNSAMWDLNSKSNVFNFRILPERQTVVDQSRICTRAATKAGIRVIHMTSTFLPSAVHLGASDFTDPLPPFASETFVLMIPMNGRRKHLNVGEET